MDPGELHDVEIADIYVGDQVVATLHRLADRVRFAYLGDADTEVATTLPRAHRVVDTHAPGALPPFFAGLLPEGRRLAALRSAVKTSADDEFSLLLAVGSDTIGNVSILPSGTSTQDAALTPAATSTTHMWDQQDFSELVNTSVGRDPERFAIPGVQDKVSARMITFPVRSPAGSGTTHILKLNPLEFGHLVENEAFFAAAARASGLTVAETRVVHDRNGQPGLLVTRFDRVVDGDEVRRLAQEDACQVLGRYPADKYLMTAEQIVAGLMRQCRAAPVATRDLFRQLVFAYLTCNGDGHAKNFSILRHGDEWRISPAYDVPSSYPYRDRTMAVSLNGKRDERIGLDDFLAFASATGLRERPARRAITEVTDRADLWIDRLGELPFDDRRIHDLTKAIRYRQGRLRGR